MGKMKSVVLNQLVNVGRALAPVMVLHRTTVGMVRGYLELAGEGLVTPVHPFVHLLNLREP